MLHRVPCGRSGHFHGVHSRQLHHLSLACQKATLGTFLGDGSGRFGLESCWGSAVSEWPLPRSPLQAVASSFFRESESNVRQLFGGMVRFCCFGTVLHRVPCTRSGHFHGVHSGQLHHLSLGRQKATLGYVRQFFGGWFWQVWA